MAQSHPLFERELRFAHRVNSRAALSDFLASNANVAEGDTRWGDYRHAEVRERAVVMAHPPSRRSDLKLAEWIDGVNDSGRAIKLDFKDPAAIAPALALLEGRMPGDRVVLNADFVRGPRAPKPKFDRRHLVQMAEGLPGAVVSIGSTTRPWSGRFTSEHTDSMLALAAACSGAVTLALRLSIVEAAPGAIEPLIAAGLHITIWNSGLSNPVTREQRDRLRERFPDAWLDLSYAIESPNR